MTAPTTKPASEIRDKVRAILLGWHEFEPRPGQRSDLIGNSDFERRVDEIAGLFAPLVEAAAVLENDLDIQMRGGRATDHLRHVTEFRSALREVQ